LNASTNTLTWPATGRWGDQVRAQTVDGPAKSGARPSTNTAEAAQPPTALLGPAAEPDALRPAASSPTPAPGVGEHPTPASAAAKPISDRARRRKVTCASCGLWEPNRGHGYCVACYSRWVYWGSPEGGPPPAGATAPRPTVRQPVALPEACVHGHLWATNLTHDNRGARRCLTCKRENDARSKRRRFARRHGDHDVITTSDGRPYCRTCVRGDHDIDEIAVVRAARGDAPERLRIAEREAAIVQLRGYGYSYRLIGERVGCTLRTAWYTCDRLGVTTPANARTWWAEHSADMQVST
jgi:hypothetical protein